MLEISCRHVIDEISNYVDGEIDPELRARIEAHLAICDHCTAILDGTRNVIRIAGDDRVFPVPQDFGKNLYRKLDQYLKEQGG